LNSSTDHTSAKKEEIKGKASDSSAQARHALDDFEQAASAKTNSAVEQGKSDIDESKAKSAGYVQQVIETAQVRSSMPIYNSLYAEPCLELRACWSS